MNDSSPKVIVERWRQLWDGDLSNLPDTIAANFVAHAAPLTGTGPDTVRGRDGLKDWIVRLHSALDGLEFTLEVGPINDAEFSVVRWRATGTYSGGVSGAAATAVGRPVEITGIDIVRLRHGLIEEYWLNLDSLLFMQLLGVEHVPALSNGSTREH